MGRCPQTGWTALSTSRGARAHRRHAIAREGALKRMAGLLEQAIRLRRREELVTCDDPRLPVHHARLVLPILGQLERATEGGVDGARGVSLSGMYPSFLSSSGM